MTKVKFGKSIRTQLLISFFFIVLLLILVGIASIYHVRRVYTNGKDIYVTNLKTVDYLKTLNINVRRIDKCIVDILEKFDDIPVEDNRKEIEKIQEQNTKLMFNYENLDYSEEEKDNYDQCRLDMVTFNKYVVTLLDMVDKGELDEAKKLYQDKIIDIEADACNMLDKVADIATKNAEDSNAENYNRYQKVVLAIVVTLILTTILAVLISIRVSNNFTHKLGVIQRWAKRISEYNVSEDIAEIGKDEFGITTKALNDSQFMIRDLVEKIMEESTTMSDTGKEVSEAIRKSKKRIENMNLTVAQASAAEKEFLQKVIDTMLDEDISPTFMSKMKELLDMIEKNSIESEEFCKELTGMATYMEQIAITSDYQNEMAKTHREQVGKFKIN